mmetsp:Transcript_41596/g.99719  ORF Transcript_41596/g.99719 Transcript_41596/m.99719 type:complete len:200 (-) Transcript_41596:483-1082(-)
MYGLIVFVLMDQPRSFHDTLREVGREQNPTFLPLDECVPCRCRQRVDMDTRSGPFGTNQPPTVRWTTAFTDQPEQVITKIRRDTVIVQDLVGESIIIEPRIEDVQRRIVTVVLKVLQEVPEFDTDRPFIVIFTTFESSVYQPLVFGQRIELPLVSSRPFPNELSTVVPVGDVRDDTGDTIHFVLAKFVFRESCGVESDW